ncbi:hypothetical protein BCR44DRAFT_51939 [Catenaria anguillulae PL171]|uniref:ATP-dependent DNA helicase n=1 Tax=Catenaria anguillulae PL171 TaxID=765915 RepID=A0A1Y2H6C2_9FUNG|nr:hypothetical protein BCR44DRAFT_51939 [Catenaria anguillulae PL171]
MLARADKALRQFKQAADRPFGGIVMLICGNFGHLPPVQDTALIDTILGGKHTAPMARQDLELFRLLTTVIRLTENHRFINDCLWERIVREARIGKQQVAAKLTDQPVTIAVLAVLEDDCFPRPQLPYQLSSPHALVIAIYVELIV